MRRLKKPQYILLIGVLTVVLLFGGCNNKETPPTAAPTQTTAATQPAPSGTETTEPEETTLDTLPDEETIPEETRGIDVESEYFVFYYPLEWGDGRVQMTKTTANGNEVTTFRATVGGQEVELFSIVVGPNEAEGYLHGQLVRDGQAPINVYSVIRDYGEDGYSKEQYDEICALQERINEITIQFQEDPTFVPNRPM